MPHAHEAERDAEAVLCELKVAAGERLTEAREVLRERGVVDDAGAPTSTELPADMQVAGS